MNELHLTRVYRAPRNLVWKVWTDPEHVPTIVNLHREGIPRWVPQPASF